MAILAKIRNRPIYLIMIIGLALFAFVISGIFKGNGPSRNNIGSVNGDEISNERFSKLLESQKNNKTSSIQAVKNVWNNIIREKVYAEAIEKSGIVIGEKDVWDAMISNPAIQNDQNFKDEAGLFDENKLKEYIATLKDNSHNSQGASQWQSWVDYETNVKNNLAQSTYNNLVKSGLTATLKEGQEVYNADNTSSDIEFVFIPYSTIKDSEINITDSDKNIYLTKHAKEYTVDANTAIDFVKFEVKPSKEDIDAVKAKIKTLIYDHKEWNDAAKADENVPGFVNTKNAKEFVTNNSDLPFQDKLYLAKDLPNSMFDSLVKKPVGYVYGPYRDGDYFKIAKILSKDGEESVKSSHILIAYKGATRANPEITRSREEAEVLANKILKEVTKANFTEKAKEYSDGPSASKGGELGFFKQNQLAKEFNDYIFDPKNKVGNIKLVETSFGYHIIKIEEKKNDPGLKLAIVALKIDPSEETESKIYQETESFALELTNGKDIHEFAKEKKLKVNTIDNILELNDQIGDLGRQREIVKWTFDKDSKIGDIKRFDLENGDYAVVILKEKNQKGLASINKVNNIITPILKKDKKLELIRNKITGKTFEERIKSVNKTSLKLNGVSISNADFKSGGKDVNAASALLYIKENDTKIINGNNGIYIVKIIKKNMPYEIKNFSTYSNNITKKLKNKTSKIVDALKDNSTIEDNRALFY